MPSWVVLIAIIYMGIIRIAGDCPGTCECKWKSGKESVLCGNKNLTSVPLSLDSGTQLLDLSGNNLTSIHENEFAAARLLNLQKVFLSRCSIRTLHSSSFRSLMNLVDLDLSFNLLTTVPYHTFEHIPELMELKLNGNPIVAIRNSSFKSVPHLNKLDLSECRISYIESYAFFGLENSLEWLKLENNRITNLKAISITNLGNLHGLELAGNPWNCSCGLRALREWVLRHNIPQSISPICRYPDRLFGKVWDKLDIDDFACLPKVVAVNSDKIGPEGGNVTMSCNIRSSPLPVIRWLKREKVIANLSGLHSGGRHLFTVQVANTASNLTITSAELTDSGEYVCRAENKAGRAEARINLEIIVKPEDQSWPARVVIATAAVVILFSLAAILSVVCICCLWKRHPRFHRHAVGLSVAADAYEMNHKANNYDKVIRNNIGNKDSSDPANRRNGYIGVADSEYSEDVCVDLGNGCAWKSANIIDRQISDKKLSPDLHIPRLREYRSGPTEKQAVTSAAELLASTPGLKTHIMHKEGVPHRASLYTSSTEKYNYPDLIETDKNTLPRRGYKQRRNRTGSCGSESMSPLLQGSSDESCDSGTPLALIDIPDPYPELDKFLKEYRNLQEQLYQMKESCENLKQDNLRFKAESASADPPKISRLMDETYKSPEEPIFKVYNSDSRVEPMFSDTRVEPMFSASRVEPMFSATQQMLSDGLNAALQKNLSTEDNSSRYHGDNFWLTRSKLLNTLSEPTPRNTFYES